MRMILYHLPIESTESPKQDDKDNADSNPVVGSPSP